MEHIGRWGRIGIIMAALLGGGTWHAQAQGVDMIELPGTIRDFSADPESGHPDFEARIATDRGIVKKQLGTDLKPVYAGVAGNPTTSGQTNYDQWYRDTDGVNLSMPFDLILENIGTPENPKFRFFGQDFFPIDDQLLGNEERTHNFHFTLEVHARFLYNGGGYVTFEADDDIWLFINGILVIDLGGVHPTQTATVHLDDVAEELGLTPGQMYDFDLFFAERHTRRSTLIIETTLELMPGRGCFIKSPGDEVERFIAPCVGTDGDDMIRGTDGDDFIVCGGGNDMVEALGGNDTIECGDGDDMVMAGDGNDVVNAGDGDDEAEGGEGDDVLNGENGDDMLVGGSGNDCLNGGAGDDATIADDDATLDGDNGLLAVRSLTVLAPARRINTCPTGFSPLPRGVDTHNGGNGNDLLCGSNGIDIMSGGRGRDNLRGFGGNDILSGNQNNDTINGDDGRNDCDGGAGSNNLQNCSVDIQRARASNSR
jgi:fibro-slime domain-containing protein